MATPITVKQMVADIDDMVTRICDEEGIDKNEFLFNLYSALIFGVKD